MCKKYLYTYKSSEQEVGYKRSMFSKARYGFLSLRLLDIQCQDVAHVKLKSEIGMRNFQAIRRHIQMKLGTNMFTLKICGVDVDTPVDAVTGQQYEADYIEKHPDKFKGYNNVDELFEVLESDDKYNKN